MRDVWALFCATPWDSMPIGMGGSIRTNVSRTQMKDTGALLGMTPERLQAIFPDIMIMEEAAITYWSRKR